MNRSINTWLRLSFRHVQFSGGRRRGETYALLEVMKSRDIVRGWIGVATCSRRDAFTKSIGRRLALDRLLDAVPQHERDARKLIIEEFKAHGYLPTVSSAPTVAWHDVSGNLITGS